MAKPRGTADRPTPLAPRDVAELLRAAATVVQAELTALPGAALAWHPAPGEWCVKEIVGHLVEAERRGFAGRIRTILAEDRPALVAWDQAAVARQRGDCEQDPARLLAEFAALREASAGLVGSLTPADLRRAGRHPAVGELTVGDLLHEWVHHDRTHLRQMLATVQAFVWPGMGNAQRFSQPTGKTRRSGARAASRAT